MGTPEFPDLGKHCSVDICKQIDFLPFTCDRCLLVFCLDHRSYMKHTCPKGDREDVTCRDCNVDHCLKHRFGPDHTCPGPRKPEPPRFLSFMSGGSSSSSSKKEAKTITRPNKPSSSRWSNLLSSAEAGITKLGNDISHKLQFSSSSSGGNDGMVEVCPQCGAKFSSVTVLVEHVEKTHERNKKQSYGKSHKY
ncbi:hypothetical protein DY000_02035817 [Brassica cretica]|uniref:AN1-type domain-containing protein n=1 Tax=Brassica cretica TaxID=69181 RepID=A0ABQ7DRF6_BRACR|nr:hypothetical protein DY000_02035817 [Brassica cretica]